VLKERAATSTARHSPCPRRAALALAEHCQHNAEIGRNRLVEPRRAAKGTSVILVLNQYKCIGCSPGKHPDTRTMTTGSDDDSLDIVPDRYLSISV
jgi:hypothetical protein